MATSSSLLVVIAPSVWNANTHDHLATLEGHTGDVFCLNLYGNKLFSGSDDCTIRVLNVKEDWLPL